MMQPEEDFDVVEYPEGDYLDDEPDELDQEYVDKIRKLAEGKLQEHLHKHKHSDEFPDSISIGTEGKGGNIKCYGNAKEFAEFKKKFDNMFELRKYANEKMKSLEEKQ